MIKLIFAGDFIPHNIDDKNVISKPLQDLLSSKDLSFCNLETSITNSISMNKSRKTLFKVSPNTVKQIHDCCFDVACLANNHITDYSEQGVVDTISHLENAKIGVLGAGENKVLASKPYRIVLNGKKISFLNYAEEEFNAADGNKAGANIYSDIKVYYDLKREREISDYVFIIYHGGVEHHYYPLELIRDRFRYMIDMGADSVISHHTHCISGHEKYKEKHIFYGLGNFFFPTKQTKSKKFRTGIILELNIEDSGAINYVIHPVISSKCSNFIDLQREEEIFKLFDDISSNIIEKEFIQNYWSDFFRSNINKVYLNYMLSNKLLYRIFKNIKCIQDNISINPIKLNALMCDSNRELIIRKFKLTKHYK